MWEDGKERALAATNVGARVTFVCDLNADSAEHLASQLSECGSSTSFRDIDWETTDAVFVCTPPSERDFVTTAIEHGVPVFIEKPIGVSADDCEKMWQALKNSATLTAVGYMNRYRKSVQRARQRLAESTILAASSDWLVGTYSVPWWKDKASSGGPLNEQATHLIDLARYLVGEISMVQGTSTPLPGHTDLVGTAALSLQFTQGASFSLLYSCQAKTKMINFTVYTPDQFVRLEGWDFRLMDDEPENSEAEAPRNAIFQSEVEAFLSGIVAGSSRPIVCDLEDAFKTQRVVDALNRAIKSGRAEPVFLS